ncbi:MAG: 2-(1,2-epoxy-1,2-dihydrophenyl)acetyl-CoA isomerase PaaG [Pseudomonadota bacterium]
MDTISFSVTDGVATLQFNRPDRLNAFTAQMHAEVHRALQLAAKDESVRALLICAAGRGFCAGQDLNDRQVSAGGQGTDLGDTLDTLYNPMIKKIKSLELPVVAAVNGVAAGAGANIALACDIVLAGRSASFIQSFCRLGLVPDSGGTWHLPRLVGPARAAGLALLGDRLDAETAERWGLIWRCVDDDALVPEATALCQHFARQPTAGLARIKRALAASWSNTLAEQLDLERDFQRGAGRSEDYREGVQAFLEKREANFTGR